MGVRISWLMLARNSLLARLAASAACLAWRNSSSNRLRSAMSLTTTRPTAAPAASRATAASTLAQNNELSLLSSRNSQTCGRPVAESCLRCR